MWPNALNASVEMATLLNGSSSVVYSLRATLAEGPARRTLNVAGAKRPSFTLRDEPVNEAGPLCSSIPLVSSAETIEEANFTLAEDSAPEIS